VAVETILDDPFVHFQGIHLPLKGRQLQPDERQHAGQAAGENVRLEISPDEVSDGEPDQKGTQDQNRRDADDPGFSTAAVTGHGWSLRSSGEIVSQR